MIHEQIDFFFIIINQQIWPILLKSSCFRSCEFQKKVFFQLPIPLINKIVIYSGHTIYPFLLSQNKF